MNEYNTHSKKLEKEQQNKPKEKRRKGVRGRSAETRQKVKFHINIQKANGCLQRQNSDRFIKKKREYANK